MSSQATLGPKFTGTMLLVEQVFPKANGYSDEQAIGIALPFRCPHCVESLDFSRKFEDGSGLYSKLKCQNGHVVSASLSLTPEGVQLLITTTRASTTIEDLEQSTDELQFKKEAHERMT